MEKQQPSLTNWKIWPALGSMYLGRLLASSGFCFLFMGVFVVVAVVWGFLIILLYLLNNFPVNFPAFHTNSQHFR